MTDYERAREAIAEKINDAMSDLAYLYEHDSASRFGHNRDVLIAEILHLTWPDGSPMIAVVKSKQELPKNPWQSQLGKLLGQIDSRQDTGWTAYRQAQQEILNAGYVQVAKEK